MILSVRTTIFQCTFEHPKTDNFWIHLVYVNRKKIYYTHMGFSLDTRQESQLCDGGLQAAPSRK